MSPRGAQHDSELRNLTKGIAVFKRLRPPPARSALYDLRGLPEQNLARSGAQRMAHESAHGEGQSKEHGMNRLYAILVALLLTSCGAKPLSSEKTDNPEVWADYLATIDGCRLWRGNTGNHYVFFSPGANHYTTSPQKDESHGKSCLRHQLGLSGKGH